MPLPCSKGGVDPDAGRCRDEVLHWDMVYALLMASLARGGEPPTPKQDADRAAIGVIVGEFYGGLVIGLGGWWLASQITPTQGLNEAIIYTAPAGVAAGGVVGAAVAGGQSWAPVAGMAAAPMAAGLGVATVGASKGNREIAAIGVGLMVLGAPLSARYTALHLSKKRDQVTVTWVPTSQGLRLEGRW